MVLWYLALTNKFDLAKSLLFNNKAYTKIDRILMTATPKNAATILEILTYHKNQCRTYQQLDQGNLRKGDALDSLGRLSQSIEAYKSGLKLDPKHLEMNRKLQLVQIKKTQVVEDDDNNNTFNEVMVDIEDMNLQ
eukprot:gene7410-8665_t